VLTNGFWQVNKNQWVYSFSLFAVLKHLMRLLVQKREFSVARNQIDTLSVKFRYWALNQLSDVFLDWPESFLSIASKHDLYYYDFYSMYRTSAVLPFWLIEPLKQHRHFPKNSPDSEHVQSAIVYLQSNGMKVNKHSISKLLGVHNSAVIDQVFNKGS
jgi:hypothetical protein